MPQQPPFNDWRKNVNQFLGKDFWSEFQDVFKQDWPLVNLYQANQNRLICLIALPGVADKKNLELYIQHQALMIKGSISDQTGGYQPITEEFSTVPFERTIDLPFPVHPSPLEATYKKGILRLILEKSEPKSQKGVMVVEED